MAKKYSTPAHQETGTCYCPACAGLECLERPRFVPGQLLSDADLNDQLSYLLAKNRLHNRYLHGWGVVCGLEVACSDCDGVVTVKPGYAIDPCGNDVIVCAEQDFNLVARIREICDASRRTRRTDCVPARPPAREICKDVEQTWCITLRYKEQEARPITALRRETAGCGCGCNGSGKKTGCGCGCHGGRSTASTSGSGVAVRSGVGTTVAACEPSRIFETYELDACLAPAGMCGLHWDRKTGVTGLLSQLFSDDTMLGRIAACLGDLVSHLTRRVPLAYFTNLATLGLTQRAVGDVRPQQQYQIYCSVVQAVIDLYESDPFNTRCALPDTLAKLTCPQPETEEKPNEYARRLYQPVMNVYGLLIQYVIDCVCKALLPPCPVDPGDDAVILGCVTVRDNKIIRICNFCGRHTAGSFPALKYWFSLTPLIGALLQAVCCRPELVRAQSPLVNELVGWLDTLDPDGSLRNALAESDFALPRMYAGQIGDLLGKVQGIRPLDLVKPDGVNLATTIDRPIEQVRAELEANQVTVVEKAVRSRTDMARLQNLTVRPFAAPGTTVVAYKLGNKVIGYGPPDSKRVSQPRAPKAAVRDDEVRALRAELAALRAEVAALQAKPARGKR